MKKVKLVIPMLTGLIIGQVFAEGGERPFSIINTMRVGYDDNVYMRDDAESSVYFEDAVDLSFNASLSDRTDLLFRSQFVFSTDDADTKLDPNLYVVLSHSVSPRLLLQASNLLKSGQTGNGQTDRYDYLLNTASFVPTYVLTSKDRLSLPVSYTIKRHDDEVEDLDYTTTSFGVSWEREIRPQRTTAGLNLSHSMVEYDNRDSAYDSTILSVELGHTFNQEWHGSVEVGVNYIQPDYADFMVGPIVVQEANNDETMSPVFKAGLTYTPTPRTRIAANFSHQVQESNADDYGSGTVTAVELGAQYDFTAKIMGKATTRFQQTKYDKDASETGGGNRDTERLRLDLRLQYKLNRINFLELGYRYTDKSGDYGDWDQNRIDLGWRVEL